MKNCILAIDAGGTFLKSALIAGGAILRDTGFKIGVDSDLGTAEEVRAAYKTLIGEQMKKAEMLGLTVTAVSVDTPGPFDYKTGTPMMTHKYRAIYGISLIPWIREAAGELPVTFVHDSAAFITGAVSELPGVERAAGVMIGTGLGFALWEDGRPLLNEVGSPRVSIYKAPYRDGIAEDQISGRGITRRFNGRSAVKVSNAKEVGDLADAGNPDAIAAYAETGSILAEIIAPILAEHKIEALKIGGQISRSFGLFEKELKEGLASRGVFCDVSAVIDVDGVHLLGAARCAAEGLFVY